LFGARRNEATARAVAQQQNLRDLQDRIVRDVNKAWLEANSAYQRLSVVQQLVNQAALALNLAQARYQLGLSSIVELTQAQLNLTQAQIEQVNATYDYQTQLSVLNYQIGNLR
jgi:outer membrane protein